MLRAAVVVPIVDADPPRLLFVRRAAHLRRNPGQIAFPGGLVDPGDADERHAALREFAEELGIPSACVRIIARLGDVVTPIGPVTVAPFVGILPAPVEMRLDPGETESVVEVPLAAIYQPGAVHEGVEQVDRYAVHTWLFDYDGTHVWGATGRMLHDLLVRYPEIAALPLTVATAAAATSSLPTAPAPAPPTAREAP